jgi:hypothetical protein
MVKIRAAEKRAAVVQARSEGHTWAQCAEIAGYSTAEAAIRAFNQACSQLPQSSVEELIRQEEQRLDACDARLSAILVSRPVKVSAMARATMDPRTCSCELRYTCPACFNAKTHAPGCTVEPVYDTVAEVAAIRERRLIGESLRRMRGADKPLPDEDQSADVAEWLMYVQTLDQRAKAATAEVAVLRARLAGYEDAEGKPYAVAEIMP